MSWYVALLLTRSWRELTVTQCQSILYALDQLGYTYFFVSDPFPE
jgi:hypothetical protein